MIHLEAFYEAFWGIQPKPLVEFAIHGGSLRRLTDIDLRLIRVFCAIVDANGFQGAQISLNMAQSTLSTHLASLEAKLGSRLCERGRSGFRLTPAGQETYEAARKLFSDLDCFEASMDNIHRRPACRFRIGVLDSVVSFHDLNLTNAIEEFSKRNPTSSIEMDTGSPSHLQSELISGNLDLIISGSISRIQGFEYTAIADEVHHLYCGRSHPWFAIPDQEISRQDVLESSYSVRRYMYFDDAHRLGQMKPSARVGSMEAQEILILSGQYVGCLPKHRGDVWGKTGSMRAVRKDDWTFSSRFFAVFDPRLDENQLRRRFVTMLISKSSSTSKSAPPCWEAGAAPASRKAAARSFPHA